MTYEFKKQLWMAASVIFFLSYLSYRNQSIDLTMELFLYDRDLCHERVKLISYLKSRDVARVHANI